MKRSIWHEDYQILRDELHDLRKRSGLTQVKLAKILDKPQSFIAKYENGDRNLDLIEVIAICNACDTEVVSFIEKIMSKLQG